MTQQNQKTDVSTTKTVIGHLDDFRSAIIKIAVALSLGFVISFYFTPQLITILKYPLITILKNYDTANHGNILRCLNPTGSISISAKVSLCSAIIITLPATLYFLSSFIFPALTKREKKLIVPALLFGALLFCAGLMFCYFIALPLSLNFLWGFTNWMGIDNDWTLEYYLNFVSQFLILFGCSFEAPVLILSLVKLELVSYAKLKRSRRYVIVIIFIIAAVITPPDIISQISTAVPLLILYELSMMGAYIIDKKQRIKPNQLAG